MNRTLGVLALALVTAAAGGAAYACDHDGCAGKSADCAAKHADCAAKMESAAGVEGHECGMESEECTAHMKKDAATHGWLGVGLDLSPEGQMSIGRIWAGSPAEKAGFQIGDQILSMNGVEVGEKNQEKLFTLMRDAKIGDKVTFAVARGSENLSLEATLARMPDEVLSESIEKHVRENHKLAKNQ